MIIRVSRRRGNPKFSRNSRRSAWATEVEHCFAPSPDHVNVVWLMVVRINDHAQSIYSEDRRHGLAITQALRFCNCLSALRHRRQFSTVERVLRHTGVAQWHHGSNGSCAVEITTRLNPYDCDRSTLSNGLAPVGPWRMQLWVPPRTAMKVQPGIQRLEPPRVCVTCVD